MPGRGESILQQEKKESKIMLSFSICTFLMQKERYHRGYPLKQSLLGIFGSLLTILTRKINKTSPDRASTGAAVTGRHLVLLSISILRSCPEKKPNKPKIPPKPQTKQNQTKTPTTTKKRLKKKQLDVVTGPDCGTR